MAAILWLLPLACGIAAAQNTTVSGTVYDPRTTSAALPLPNVLVYASTTPVSAPAAGVQCLTVQTPSGSNIVSYAYTAVDGTFTLQNVPENTAYTLVIQAGKWQRQFSESVGAGPLSGLILNMPATHTQGNIPMIAIATGSVDGVECVLRDMGIADTEFTDDNQTVNPGGYIHLYKGSSSAGAQINASTPSEALLMNGASVTPLNAYDMVMFPCQGNPSDQATATGATNLLDFANAGGRVFTTHYSYAWLYPGAPYDSQFAPVANWSPINTVSGELSESQITTGVGTVATNFSDGATLAQWLENSGATVAGTSNQIDISTLRTDVDTVIPPTQSWVTLNSGSYAGQTGNPVMQMTFNAPVGAPAASQCGRIMYNDYHVYNISDAGATFPTECPDPATHVMSAQEKMLEYALFDLSTFVQPVVVPTLNVTFNPSPVVVKSGATGDQLTVSVANTSTTTEIQSSATLTFTLPPQITVTAMNDSTGGWICTVSTLTCTRNTSLAASVTDPVTLTMSVASYTTLPSYSGAITATVSSVTFSTNVMASDNVIFQQEPPISWATPAPIVYGTPLGAAQLNATSTVAGVFVYSPVAGTVLGVGPQTLMVMLTPTDTVDYASATTTVTLNVIPATPVITLTTSANPAFMTYAVTFTASLPSYASTQTGTMTFYSGSTALGTASLSGGSASFTTTALAAGPQSITASYSGDANYGPGTSNTVAENIQDFTLAFAAGSGTASVPAGGKAAYTLVITPVDGATLPAVVSLAASNVPLGSGAVFSPASVQANSGTTTVTLNLNLPASSLNEQPRGPFGGGALPVALGLVLLPFARRLRNGRARLIKLVALLVLTAAMAAGFSGCGGKLSSQSFSFTVTANSGSLAHSVTAQLTVK
jgi:hypothetical protein